MILRITVNLMCVTIFGGILRSLAEVASTDGSCLRKDVLKRPCRSDEVHLKNFCVKDCPLGSYIAEDKKCQSCHSSCSACNEKGCLACLHSKYLTLDGACKEDCVSKSALKKSSGSRRVRLVKGSSILEGVVEVYYNGSWGTICSSEWGEQDATVACKELKFGNVIESKIVGQKWFKPYDFRNKKIWFSDVRCRGKEDSIFDCPKRDGGKNKCSHMEDVAIRCSGPDMRRTCEVDCGDGFFKFKSSCQPCPLDCRTCTSMDTCLSCNEMRFLHGTKCVANCPSGMFGDGDSRRCMPCSEQCRTCKYFDVCTSCHTDKERPYLDAGSCVSNCGKGVVNKRFIRLAGTNNSQYKGLLEVKYAGKWHTICSIHFFLDTARVFCRELGFGEPLKYSGGLYGTGKGPILKRYIRCKGDETSFISCYQGYRFYSYCDHNDDVGLWCKAPTRDVRMDNNCIEKCPDGTYRDQNNICELCDPICLTCKDDASKCVTCRERYFHNGTSCVLQCPRDTYADSKLRKCKPCGKNCTSCSLREDNCLSCAGPLVHNGTHCVASCPKNTYQKEFDCVEKCGYKHYPKDGKCRACPFKCLFCNASGVCLACDYDHRLTKEGRCRRSCPSGQYSFPLKASDVHNQPELRLSSKEGYVSKGRLEIYHDGEWGTVCDDNWYYGKGTSVACRQLLLGPPKVRLYLNHKNTRGQNVNRTWLDQVECTGYEERLSDCKRAKWGVHDCVASEDVHIECHYPGMTKCVPSCPTSYHVSGEFCIPCASACINCSGTASNCTSCKQGYVLTEDNRCLEECPLGFYKKDGLCEKCHVDCLTCNGPTDHHCTSCLRPKLLLKVMCVDSCLPKQYERTVNPYINLTQGTGPFDGIVMLKVGSRVGFLCDRRPTLEDGQVICRELHMGNVVEVDEKSMYHSYRTPVVMKNPICTGHESSIFDCPLQKRYSFCSRTNVMFVKCSGPDLSSQCIEDCPSTKNLYVDDQKRCAFCSKNCLGCIKNATLCTGCPKGKLLTWDKKCVEFCPEGTYYESKSKTCKKCNLQMCLACRESPEICTVCANGKYSYKAACLTKCLDEDNSVEGVGNLRLTKSFLYHVPYQNVSSGYIEIMVNKTWKGVCFDGFNMKAAAVVCHHLGYGDPVSFSSRYLDYRLGISEMIAFNCTGNEASFEQCSKVVKTCRTYYMVKLTCVRYSPIKRCLTSCEDGFYAVRKQCRRCSSNCLTCAGSANHCTSCNSTQVMRSSKCEDKCEDGYFIQLNNMTCQRCSDQCRTCMDGYTDDRCTSCDDPYYLRGTKCVESCYPDHSLNELMPHRKPSVKLRNGSFYGEGFLWVMKDGKWNMICEYGSTGSRVKFTYDLVCQELGFEQASIIKRKPVVRNLMGKTLTSHCQLFESSFSDCDIRPMYWCYSTPFVTCSRKPLDKRVCRKIMKKPCAEDVCYPGVSCVEGDGRVVGSEESFCRRCPSGYFGDGDECTLISKTRPTSSYRQLYRERFYNIGVMLHMVCRIRSSGTYIPSRAYHWSKDGKPISDGFFRNGVLAFRISHYSQGGIYNCTIGNSLGSLTFIYNVTITGKPIITRADTVSVVHGQSVILTCEVFANPPADITWLFENKTLSESTSRNEGPRVMNNGSLYIAVSILKDAGKYTCVANNSRGSSSEIVVLRIGDEIHFEKKPGVVIVSLKDKAVFHCRPFERGTTLPLVAWRHNGKTLRNNGKYVIFDETLTISKVSEEDCGEYYCVVNDGHSTLTTSGKLIIKNVPPCIYNPPQNLALKNGMYARFYCEASGEPPPTISWEIFGSTLLKNTKELRIDKVNISHVGAFVCIADSGGKKVKKVAFLSVDGIYACPYIIEQPKDAIAELGNTSSFYCDGAAYNHNVNILWYKDGRKIIDNDKYDIIDKNRKLVIKNVDRHDIGSYTCVVDDGNGESASLIARLKLTGSQSPSTESSNPAGIIIGVLVCILVIIVVLYFVYRYRRHGVTPVDVMKRVKRKSLSRLQSNTRHTVLNYNTAESHDDEDGYDTADTNPFVRD